jgi:hypothetical protein
MPTTSNVHLQNYLRSVTDDALFVLASSDRVDHEALAETAKRRAAAHETALHGGELGSSDAASWTIAMCAAMAPIGLPLWLPMRELVESLTLEAGARGVRSLFTSKPSDKQVERARTLGAITVRVLTAVLGADAPLNEEERLMRRCMVSALGLSEEDTIRLLAEPPMPAEAVDIPKELEPKQARLLATGAWAAGCHDGLDPREDAVVLKLCAKLALTADDTEFTRRSARAKIDGRKLAGTAAVDAMRYVLSDQPDRAAEVARLIAHLALPAVHRTETLASVNHGGPIRLARRHALERGDRELCLALAWFAALGTDPSQTRVAQLAVRHDRVASDLGSRTEAQATRALVEAIVHEQLLRAVLSSGQ